VFEWYSPPQKEVESGSSPQKSANSLEQMAVVDVVVVSDRTADIAAGNRSSATRF